MKLRILLSVMLVVSSLAFLGCETASEGDGQVWEGNYVIASVAGAEAISGYTEVTGNLTITAETRLDLSFLESLETVGGSLTISGNALVNFAGLENLSSIGGSLIILGNAIADFTGLDNLQSVGGSVLISATTAITLNGLDSLESIGGTLNMTGNGLLVSLEALANLTSVENFAFVANPLVTNLVGLEGIMSLNNVTISANPGLCTSDAEAFVEGITVSGTVTIRNNKVCADE